MLGAEFRSNPGCVRVNMKVIGVLGISLLVLVGHTSAQKHLMSNPPIPVLALSDGKICNSWGDDIPPRKETVIGLIEKQYFSRENPVFGAVWIRPAGKPRIVVTLDRDYIINRTLNSVAGNVALLAVGNTVDLNMLVCSSGLRVVNTVRLAKKPRNR